MKINSFLNYIFWQYKPDADLPDLVVLENLLLYGELDLLFTVPKLFLIQQIHEVQEKIGRMNPWGKRAFFIDQILLPR